MFEMSRVDNMLYFISDMIDSVQEFVSGSCDRFSDNALGG